ncbi:helicase-associated domain-containing protein [Cohnella suwonensis]|uniref:Helicase-associated domain-containing protein n=1 Tax=Cohnella suwonensis TaxID=696072 RepID=A0ABW0M161_9BACL
MNVRRSLERLPESFVKLIGRHPAVRDNLAAGEPLASMLAGEAWAKRWLSGCERRELLVLKGIVRNHAARPFELETLAGRLSRELPLAGAEIKLAVARLRRSGVAFAVRKAWGDKLIYVPEDIFPIWQTLLLPAWEGNVAETSSEADVRLMTEAYRPPLSVQLLAPWHLLLRHPLGRTGKDGLHQPTAAKLNDSVRFGADDVISLSLAYPHAEQLGAQAALAIDLGMRLGLVEKDGEGIRTLEGDRLNEWLSLAPGAADAKLYDLVSFRHAMADHELQLAASAVRSAPADVWVRQDRMFEGKFADKTEEWLKLMEAFGWAERGVIVESAPSAGAKVFRLTAGFGKRDPEPGARHEVTEESIFVQPDGEVFVPPEAPLRFRWTLKDIAEIVSEDALSLFRLDKRSCERAYNSGYSLAEVLSILERGNQCALPVSVAEALGDWFAAFGKTRFEEAVLLRTDSKDVAEALLRDGRIAGRLKERIGEREFIVERSELPSLRSLLKRLGYPAEETDRRASKRTNVSEAAQSSGEEAGAKEADGWTLMPHEVSVYAADVEWPEDEELFPGLSDIPAAWIAKPRVYHASTLRQLMEKAISWEAPVVIGRGERSRAFLPTGTRDEGGHWTVSGRWRSEEAGSGEQAIVRAGDIAELMIDLPLLSDAEPLAMESD